MTPFVAFAALLFACKEPLPELSNIDDVDGDGFKAQVDCDDNNPLIFPSAPELCNGVDDDCNGNIDDEPTDGVVVYGDSDGDGYGDALTEAIVCNVAFGVAAQAGDCDDTDPLAYPGAAEQCGGIDYDCDGVAGDFDEDAVGNVPFYYDNDNDGQGGGTPVFACSAPAGTYPADLDCDDNDPNTYVGATETCDGLDRDCDGLIDDDDPDTVGGNTFFADSDMDGYGTAAAQVFGCGLTPPIGGSINSDDCDDTNGAIYPGASEFCNGLDDDCDTYVDDLDLDTPPLNRQSWYADGDGDGVGAGPAVEACEAPVDTVSSGDDCDDADAAIYPGADELCDTLDNDCDTLVDDDDDDVADGTRTYVDLDLDGYGDPDNYTDYCVVPPGALLDGTDCDDTTADVYPGATEVCNGGIDDNCDGLIDDDDPAALLGQWYPDIDGDGYGDLAGTPIEACDPPPDTSVDATDCDDADAAIYPGATEICDLIDNNCDALIDDEDPLVDAPLAYFDADADGYGAEPGTPYCVAPVDSIAVGGDCDDANADIYPGADEICDTVDNNCDGLVDDDDDLLIGDVTAYVDADLDGYGDEADPGADACVIEEGYSATADDCDDTREVVYPGALEVCDTYDNDCDGLVDQDDPDVDAITAYEDLDLDGYGSTVTAEVCEIEPGWSETDDDCDDDNAYVNPGVVFDFEDLIDNDCDTEIDEDVGTELYDSDDVQAIYNDNCGPCHLSSSAGGLNLVNSYITTVNVFSIDVPDMYLITPGQPGNSYIWHAVSDTRVEAGGNGPRMPRGAPPLDQADLDILETWILEGAIQ